MNLKFFVWLMLHIFISNEIDDSSKLFTGKCVSLVLNINGLNTLS